MHVKVGAADTGGRLTVIEGEMAPGLPGAPAHIHSDHDETFIILDGRLRFRIGSQHHTALPGEVVYASRDLAHGFANPFDEPARYIAVLTPSGYEQYFRTLADHVAVSGAMPEPNQIAALMGQHHTILAAPLADPLP